MTPDEIAASPIQDDETLFRRVHWTQTSPDGSLTTAAFKDRELSVDRALLVAKALLQTTAPLYGIAELNAGESRAVGDPTPDPLPENIAHALIKCRQQPLIGVAKFAKALKSIAEATWNSTEYAAVRREAERVGLADRQ